MTGGIVCWPRDGRRSRFPSSKRCGFSEDRRDDAEAALRYVRHDPMNVAACRHDTCAACECGYDARHRAVGGRRGERDHGLPARGERGAAHEVHLPADPRVDPEADGVGAHLPGEIQFKCGVDRDDARVLTDERRVVRAIARMKLDRRIVVHEVVEPLRSGDEAGHRSPRTCSVRSVRTMASSRCNGTSVCGVPC
jgi:hypothetical protein